MRSIEEENVVDRIFLSAKRKGNFLEQLEESGVHP